MDVSIIQIILIGIWAGIAGIDLFDGLIHLHRPVVTGSVIGLILGDLQTGLIVGGTLELVFLGAMPVGGAQPPNVVIGGIAGTVLAIFSIPRIEPVAAVGMAIPFAVFMQSLITLLFTVFSPVMHGVDKAIDNGKGERAVINANLLGMAILFVMYAGLSIGIVLGGTVLGQTLGNLPAWITHGLSVAGGMLTAVGFAILLKIMYAPRYAIYLALGFILVTFFNAPILPVAGIGVIIAMIEFYLARESGGQQMSQTQGGNSDGI